MQELVFSIESFSVCSPATGCVASIQEAKNADWINADRIAVETWQPDTDFMPKRTFRRLGRISKMALFAAYHASRANGGDALDSGSPVFCSRNGEFQHAAGVLNALYTEELVSPMDFSYSVHNTGQGLFSILQNDTRPAAVIAAREDVVEQALVKAYAQLHKDGKPVLVVYQEDVLGQEYHSLLDCEVLPLSFAFVVGKPSASTKKQLTLSCKPSGVDEASKTKQAHNNLHAQNIAKVIMAEEGSAKLNTDSLSWELAVRAS